MKNNNDDENIAINESERNQDNSLNNKKFQKNFITSIRKSNANLFHFNMHSSFIYEPRLCSYWYDKLSNKNNMKLKDEEIILIENEINHINELKLKNSKNNSLIIGEELKNKIISAYFVKTEFNEVTKRVENIIKNCEEKDKISCLKISKLYEEKYFQKISPSHVWYIMKNKLEMKFLKTSVKTNILINKDSIHQTWFFLKVFIRMFKLGGNFIFIDESAFYTHNNNYHQWRKDDVEIYKEIKDSFKVNLLMAVSTKKILYYKITTENTDGKIFSQFLKEFLVALNEEEKNTSLIILDNCTAHLVYECFQIFNENKLKVLFTVPYRSNFNQIELVFRSIKNITYKELFSSIENLKNRLEQIIKSEELNKTINLLFKDILNNYLNFIKEYKTFNLN